MVKPSIANICKTKHCKTLVKQNIGKSKHWFVHSSHLLSRVRKRIPARLPEAALYNPNNKQNEDFLVNAMVHTYSFSKAFIFIFLKTHQMFCVHFSLGWKTFASLRFIRPLSPKFSTFKSILFQTSSLSKVFTVNYVFKVRRSLKNNK